MPKSKRNGPNVGLGCTEGDVYKRILRTALQTCNHPEAGTLEGHLRASRFDRLLDWAERPSPQLYDSAVSYFTEAQLSALIRKYPFTTDEVPGLNPRAAALKKFYASEHRCRRQNLRWVLKRKRFNRKLELFDLARKYIQRVIGVKPDLKDILQKCDFAGGASVGVGGNRTNFMRKLFASKWSTTPTALPYAMTGLWLNEHTKFAILPGSGIKCVDPDVFRQVVKSKLRMVNCNNISFVPKTAKTDRSIAVEPLLNGFVQKGVDVYMRQELRRVGIDLRDQTRNQNLARLGSLSESNPYCTIDLAAASDSLCTEVVRELLPPDWFEFLSDIRSPWYTIDGHTARYEKFCSMGNGFCFPLQTLVFASICYACNTLYGSDNRFDFSVYGDDIIVRQNVALVVVETLKDIGFSTNPDKTFITGCFRESCGSDWFAGQDVRPVHFDKRVSDLRHLFAFHNSTWRSQWCSHFFSEVRASIRAISQSNFFRPGCDPGDTCFSVPLDVAMSSTRCRWDRRAQCWAWDEIYSLPVPDSMHHLSCEEHANALMIAALRGSASDMPYSVRYRSRPRKVRVRRWWTDPPFTVAEG